MTDPHRPARRPALSLAAPRHDGRAWALFFAAALVLMTIGPLASTAGAQVPGLPPLGGGGSGEPTEDPGGDPGGDPEGEGPIPALPVAPAGSAGATGDLKQAYYTSPASAALPATATAEFPPGLFCIVVPEGCTEDAQGLTQPIQDAVLFPALGGLDSAGQQAPQPVPAGGLPVGIISGNQRYASAIGINPLADVPEGKQFGELLVTLQLSDASFSVESPAFRTLVLGALAAYQNDDPSAFTDALQAAGSEGAELFTQDFPGLEMCVIKSPWEAGENQPRAEQPEIDPLFCSPRAVPADDGTVTFDMTFAANDSLPSGFTPGWEGVLVKPLGAQNLAYGDADYSTNYYAYIEPLGENPPAVSATLVDAPAPLPPGGGGGPVSSPSGGGGGGGFGGGSSGGSSGSSGSGSSAGSRPGTSGGTAAAPALANPGNPGGSDVGESLAVTGDEPFAEQAPASPLDSAVPADAPSSAWIPWVLLPMVLGGAFWYGRVLEASPLADVVRAGAMTRLLRDRGFPV